MRVIIRGIPNFAHVQIHEVADLDAFLNEHELRVRRRLVLSGYEGQYYRPTPQGPKRVSLYLEGVGENRRLLTERCFSPDPSLHLSALVLTLKDDRTLKTFGTASCLNLDQGDWYALDPKNDARYESQLVAAKADYAEQLRLRRIAEEREEEQRRDIDDIVDRIGYDEALRRLKGE